MTTTTGTTPVPLVRLNGAGKRYGNIVALRGITLEVGGRARSPACSATTAPASPR